MEAHQIKTFIDAMASSDLAEMEVSKDGWTLRMVRDRTPLQEEARAPVCSGAESQDSQRAPLAGVVFLRPSPEKPPFVEPGQRVKAGQTLCIIEAMKVFNEVHAETDGLVEAILVASGQDVDAGTPLVRLR